MIKNSIKQLITRRKQVVNNFFGNKNAENSTNLVVRMLKGRLDCYIDFL